MSVQVLSNGCDEVLNIPETSPSDSFLGDLAKPAFDQVQPRTRGRDEMEMEAQMPPEPGFHPGVLVGSIIVDDQMQVHLRRRLAVDLFEEPDEFLVAVSRHTVPDDFPIEHTQGGEQRGRAMAFVVVGHRPATAFLHGETGLSPIEGLDLAFLVDAQDQGFVRRIEIQAHDIAQLFEKLLVAADLEGPDKMRLEPVLLPDALNAHGTDALGLGHGPHTPVRGRGGFRVQSGFDDGPDVACWNAGDAPGPGRVLFEAGDAKSQKPLPPQLHRGPGEGQLLGDVLARHSVGRHRDDPGALDKAQRKFFPVRPGGQGGTLFGGQHDGRGGAHGS